MQHDCIRDKEVSSLHQRLGEIRLFESLQQTKGVPQAALFMTRLFGTLLLLLDG
jgi:hypothetical protein